MKAIIDCKRYDTETATLIHDWDNGRYSNDFKYRAKTLYRTPGGAWFILQEGGSSTDLARISGNASVGGWRIEPVSEEDAQGFLESHDGVRALEEHFQDRITDA